MTLEELRTLLEKTEPRALAAFLTKLAEQDKTLRDRVEALALRGVPSGYASALERRLNRLHQGRSFIPYRESGEFARTLEAWLDDVQAGLLEVDPEAAWKLVDHFLRTDARILDRADDSNGSIGDAYRRACGLWHVAAAALPPGPEWMERVYELHAGNDYGTRDAILDEAATLLSPLELRRLARKYELEAQSPGRKDGDGQAFSAAVAMGQVACALKDAVLYERSVRVRSPRPNPLQMSKIAQAYLDFGPVEKAVERLTGPGAVAASDVERLDLLAEAYEKLGNRKGLIDARRQLAESSLSGEVFAKYAALLSPEERDTARRQAVKRVLRSDDPAGAGLFLLELGEASQAAALVLRLHERLSSNFYTRLVALADGFEKTGQPLAAVLCYRTLTEQILGEGRSKAYRHAKRYVDRLALLHPGVADYGKFPAPVEYLSELRQRHGRKYSFWQLFEEVVR